MLGLSRQQKVVALGSWLGWSLDGYDLVLMLLVIPSIRNSASGFAYDRGLLVGSWAPLIAVTVLSRVGHLAPIFLGINLMIGSVILLIGAKLNPKTKDADLSD